MGKHVPNHQPVLYLIHIFLDPGFQNHKKNKTDPDYTQKNVGWFYPHYTMPIIDSIMDNKIREIFFNYDFKSYHHFGWLNHVKSP